MAQPAAVQWNGKLRYSGSGGYRGAEADPRSWLYCRGAGNLVDSWRQQSGTPAYCSDLATDGFGAALAHADPTQIAAYRMKADEVTARYFARAKSQAGSPWTPSAQERIYAEGYFRPVGVALSSHAA